MIDPSPSPVTEAMPSGKDTDPSSASGFSSSAVRCSIVTGMTESTYLTVAEAATACGVSEGVIRGRIQRGTLRSEKIFGQIVILREDLLDAGLTPIGHDERLDSGDQGPSVLPSARRKPKNAILGWFVIGALVLAGGDAMVGVDFLLDPLVPVVSLTLVAGLIFSRIRRGAFGKVWLLATAIIGILIFFGAIGNAQGVDASGRAVGLSMLIPGVLALIARLRTRNTASETGVRRGRKSIGSGRKWLLAGIGAAVVVAIAAVIGFVAFSGGIADNDQIAVSAITTEQPTTTAATSPLGITPSCDQAVLAVKRAMHGARTHKAGEPTTRLRSTFNQLDQATKALDVCAKSGSSTPNGLAQAKRAVAMVTWGLNKFDSFSYGELAQSCVSSTPKSLDEIQRCVDADPRSDNRLSQQGVNVVKKYAAVAFALMTPTFLHGST